MPDPRLYESDTYALLEPGQAEQFVSAAEVLSRIEAALKQYAGELPPDVQKFSTLKEQAQYLLDTTCEFDVEPGKSIQWYVVRLEK